MSDNYQFQGQFSNLPILEANLIVQYAKPSNRFAYWQYIDVKPTTNGLMYGAYPKLRFGGEMAARVVNQSTDRYHWADGQKNPAYDTDVNSEQQELIPFQLKRFAPSTMLGDMTISQFAASGFDLPAQRIALLAAQAATVRSVDIINTITTSSNYPSANVSTMTSLAGGTITNATVSNPYIRDMVNGVLEVIKKATNDVVQLKDLYMVTGPDVAVKLGVSAEVLSFIQQQATAPQLTEEGWSNADWAALPSKFMGLNLVVDSSVVVTSEQFAPGNNTAATRVFAWPTATILFMAKGVPVIGADSLSTARMWTAQDFSIEDHYEPQNKRHLYNVVDNRYVQVVAPETGFLVTSCL